MAEPQAPTREEGKALIWCYRCGGRWRVSVRELWRKLKRCPDCGGATDGIPADA